MVARLVGETGAALAGLDVGHAAAARPAIPLRFGRVLVVALDEYTSAYGASSAEFGWLEQTLS